MSEENKGLTVVLICIVLLMGIGAYVGSEASKDEHRKVIMIEAVERGYATEVSGTILWNCDLKKAVK